MLPGPSSEGPVTWLPVGLASGILALAISRTRVFRPLRDLVWPGHEDEWPTPQPPGLRGWVAYLLTCHTCLSAWAAAALTALQGVPAGLHPVAAWGASWAVGAALAAAVDRMAGE